MGSTAQDFLQVSFSVAYTLGGVREEHNDDAPNAAHAPASGPVAPRPATPANSRPQQAQLEQLRELEAKLQEE